MRLFVAVNLPAGEQNSVWNATESLRSAGFPLRPCAGEALHLTLRFLGSVAPDAAERLGVSLSEAVRSVKAFNLGLGGFGAFPDAVHPRVVWLGVDRHPALELLANDVELAVARHGFEPELRPFAPHITLARVRKDAADGAFEGLEESLEKLEYASAIPVERVDLMESVSGPGGASYRLLHTAPLLTEH